MHDVIIIGAGITGCSIARALCRWQLNVLVLETGSDVADRGATKANTAIVHAGYDALPGTNKAKFNILGNAMFDRLTKELDVPFHRNGSLIVAFQGDNLKILETLQQRGNENGVPGLEILSQAALREKEPNIGKDAVAALYAPTGGIVCPYELAIAMAENAAENGAQFSFHTQVAAIENHGSYFCVTDTEKNTYKTKIVVNAAGIHADEINAMLSSHLFQITPRRGEYYMVDKQFAGTFSHSVFQLPSQLGKGVLVTPTVDGPLLLGPTAEDILEKEDTATTLNGLATILKRAEKTWNAIPGRNFITTFSGIRAHADVDDFILGEAKDVPSFYNAAGIESPGLTAAPAIGAFLAAQIAEKLCAVEHKTFQPKRKGIIKFRELSPDARAAYVRENPLYGHIVCRCELVSEGEILAAIHRPLGATTVDAIKRRTRADMGRCQGGFCLPHVIEILARELHVSPTEITKHGGISQYLVSTLQEGACLCKK
ncbi:MAG: NAD(P)/FAD-dependent oxidoreductase [Christensenellaceae bacterium]|jgi:glycerol-3-phosphate dehydrogenase